MLFFCVPMENAGAKTAGKVFVKEVCEKERMEHPVGFEPTAS